MNRRVSLLALALFTPGLPGCDRDRAPEAAQALGDAERGRREIARLQCGACHQIPGVRAARGSVGPTLDGFASRLYVAGKWPNQSPMLVSWLLDPPALAPKTAMPALVRDESTARDIAAYLYTLE